MSTRNIPGVKRAGAWGIFTCRMSWKSGSLNLLEPSGPHQACHETPLPLSFYIHTYIHTYIHIYSIYIHSINPSFCQNESNKWNVKEIGEACSTFNGGKRCLRCFGGETWRKGPKCRWENDIKTDLQERGWEGVDWIDLNQNMDGKRDLANAVTNFWVPKSSGNFLRRWEAISISRRNLFSWDGEFWATVRF